ncbi:MAG: hypothetical protein CSA72_00130 [Rhodobacterales bacterium]|nr:MAG: hypothetical protein CR993_07660 [Rhodobacterales bacterium]PIE12566.1 MAG: hypothetical protein CSA72_00130 [Rhodobacterales bacterium]
MFEQWGGLRDVLILGLVFYWVFAVSRFWRRVIDKREALYGADPASQRHRADHVTIPVPGRGNGKRDAAFRAFWWAGFRRLLCISGLVWGVIVLLRMTSGG